MKAILNETSPVEAVANRLSPATWRCLGMAAILLDKTGVPYWATVPIAGAICLGTGFLFGLPALRLEGLYLALATVALAVATPKILKFKGFDYFGIFLIALMYLMPTGAIGIFNFIGIRLRRGAVAKRQS
jgi:hypothetical protein